MFEKFTAEQAAYAADNCCSDWNEQAAKCAENYLKAQPYSRQGLIDQLTVDGFTQEQTAYALRQCGY